MNYDDLTYEEQKELAEDMEADYWIEYDKSNYEQNGKEQTWKSV